MKTFVNAFLFCLFTLWTATYVQASGIDASPSSKSGIKYNRVKVDNKYGYTSAHDVLNDGNDFVFSAEDEDEENKKWSSDAKDAIIDLLSPSNSIPSYGRFYIHRQVFPDHSPLYISQRVLRI